MFGAKITVDMFQLSIIQSESLWNKYNGNANNNNNNTNIDIDTNTNTNTTANTTTKYNETSGAGDGDDNENDDDVVGDDMTKMDDNDDADNDGDYINTPPYEIATTICIENAIHRTQNGLTGNNGCN